ncbi:hypothetical protein N665_1760s0002, partial [Sinapis alba]
KLSLHAHALKYFSLSNFFSANSLCSKADWGPVVVAVILFVLLTPGLLFQIPARGRIWKYAHKRSIDSCTHHHLLRSHHHLHHRHSSPHLYRLMLPLRVCFKILREMENKSEAILFVIYQLRPFLF